MPSETPTYTATLRTLDRIAAVLRDQPDRVPAVLDALRGDSTTVPDLMFVYPHERRRSMLTELAAQIGLTAEELLLLNTIVARSTVAGPSE